jgi:hypothetical protein
MVGRRELTRLLEALPADADAAAALARACDTATAADDLTLCLLEPEDARRDGSTVDELDLSSSQALREGFEEYLADCGLDSDEIAHVAGELRRRSRQQELGLRLVIRRGESGTTWTIEQPRAGSPHTSVQAAVRGLERRAS